LAASAKTAGHSPFATAPIREARPLPQPRIQFEGKATSKSKKVEAR
jgi:hypothetical protein